MKCQLNVAKWGLMVFRFPHQCLMKYPRPVNVKFLHKVFNERIFIFLLRAMFYKSDYLFSHVHNLCKFGCPCKFKNKISFDYLNIEDLQLSGISYALIFIMIK